MSVHGARRRSSIRALAATGATLGALALGVLPATAGAATTTFTVDSTVHTNVANATADANTADGLCATANGTCTLRAAIEQANALPASPGDDVAIRFSTALVDDDATITLPSNGLRMQTTGASHNGTSNDYLGSGFFYVVDAKRPVTIDLGDAISVASADDAGNGIFLVKSQGVTIENFKNLRAGDTSIVVDRPARDTTIRNGGCLDPDTIILEACVGIISGASGIDISDVTVDSSYRFGIFVDRFKAGDAPVSDVSVTRLKSTGTQQYGDIWFELDAKVDGFTVDDAEFDSPAGYAFGLQSGSDVKDLKISGSRFLGADAYQVFTYGNSKTENLTVEDSTFDGTRWAFVDNGGSTHDGLTFRGNTFDDLNQHVLDFVDSKLTNAVIEDNTFSDERFDGNTTIWIGQPGTNNVIRNNTFTQAEGVYNNRWAIYNQANVAESASTGWSITGNHVDGYRGAASGPIVNLGNGKTPTERNTFGPRTEGTIVPLESEAQQRWFVVNWGGRANSRIQTWRPTSATADGTNLTIAVAPVTPVLGANTDPTAPVDVDVYWTADDTAEEYIGRIDDAVAGTPYQLPTDKTTGRYRVQTIDADGRSSQYSAPVQVGTIAPAPPQLLKFEDDELQGVGQPGATVTVYDEDGNPVGAPVPVQADGTWVHPGPFTGCRKLTAKQEDADGNVSDVSAALSTPACIGAPVISEIDADGDVVGTGTAGAELTLRDENGVTIGTTTVGSDGKWTVDGPVACGTTIVATQAKDGHTSVASNTITTPDCVAEPTIREVTDGGDLAGSGLPNATVRVFDEDGGLVGETTADADGNWTLDGPLPCGKELVARQTLGGGSLSPASRPFETGPCPTAPAITEIDADGDLHGTGQRGAIVTVRDQDGRVVGTARVRANGQWELAGPLPCGATLTAKQEDADGNVSPASGALDTPECPSTPAPAAPSVDRVDDAGKVRGTGTPGATVKVYDQDGSLVGEALVQADGSWTVAGPAKCGSTLSARQIAADGKVSPVSGELRVADCPAVIAPPLDQPKPIEVPKADAPSVPTSEDAIRLRCGAIPLALIDVRRGARSAGTKRYADTRISGVADRKYAGQAVRIRFLGTNTVAGSAKVGADGRFSLKVKDGDQRNRIGANKRRYRAEIAGERSVALKVTRRFDTTSVRASGTGWTVAAKASAPYRSGARVRVLVASTCDGTTAWKQAATGRLDGKGRVSVRVPAPAAGSFQLVRLETTVPVSSKKGARTSRTFTVPRGIR